MEVTKRTYQKHKTEKKITVKHYLNTNIEVKNEVGDSIYPVYVQVTYKRKNTKFKSNIPHSYLDDLPQVPVFSSHESYEEYYLSNINNEFECALTRDLNFIHWLIELYINKKGEEFDISELPKIYHGKSFELSNFIEWSLRTEMSSTLCSITGVNESEKFLKYVAFPMPYNSPPLINFEFYLYKYPELINLKTKYNSQIWLFRIFEELGDSSNGIRSCPMFYTIDQHDGRVISFPSTIFDYLTNIFQKRLSDNFHNVEVVNPIILDLNTLFAKHYDKYIDTIIFGYFH